MYSRLWIPDPLDADYRGGNRFNGVRAFNCNSQRHLKRWCIDMELIRTAGQDVTERVDSKRSSLQVKLSSRKREFGVAF
ncbi:unnamed protein product [Taenia asiatica]|uniref:Ricin B-type lectin domain-containing protein n=1 Tax=Taenia asiatica TaxID=60517 RepID=A0A0R3W004_TAEAS|nr:unnamed protein product [Taenia asiatica]